MTRLNLPRPVLRYYGGKFRIAPWIIEHLPEHRIYIEPFGGAASVLLRKPRSEIEIYNDLDDEVVNVFRVLRNVEKAERLKDLLKLTPFSRTEYYDAYRADDDGDEIERARRIIFRSYAGTGSDSLWRKNGFRYSDKTHKCDAASWASYPDAILQFTSRLQGVFIECRPALEIIEQRDGPDVCFYIDMPYPFSTRCRGKNYRHELVDADHHVLSERLHRVAGMIVISGYDCPLYAELYGGWKSFHKSTFADGGRARVETIWLNPRALQNLPCADAGKDNRAHFRAAR